MPQIVNSKCFPSVLKYVKKNKGQSRQTELQVTLESNLLVSQRPV